LESLKIKSNFLFKYKKNIFFKLGVGFVLFSVALIFTITLYTSIASQRSTALAFEASYTEQDMRYDLNYLAYSGFLISYQNSHDEFLKDVKSLGLDLNVIIVREDSVINKYPEQFFDLPDSAYYTISEDLLHPYQSESDFTSLSSSLGLNLSEPGLPNIKASSFGRWQDTYYADLIETTDGYRYYIIDNFLINDEQKISSGGTLVFTWGLIIGVVFILIFVALTYNYIRLRLRPVQLMKKRLLDLEKGDLESKIKIMGTDELAELSVSFNKLISDIKDLINQKHRLLLDVSHELKSPLARMLLLIEMIPAESKHIDSLREEISFLNDMISNLLLTDKLDIPYSQLNLEEIAASDLLNKIVGFFNQEQQKKIHINPMARNAGLIKVDLTKMIICIKNILHNGFNYADTDKGLVISVLQKNEGHTIIIQDFGPGISITDQKHIFESFYRAESSKTTSGFGLGLSISKKIIKAHRGSVELESEINSGTKFILFLPRSVNDK